MKKLILALSIFSLVMGCASKPAKKGKETTPIAEKEEVKATYNEKVTVMEVDALSKTPCPREGAWTGVEWRKVIPMANACVRAKDWHRVESIGGYLGVHAHLTPWGPYYMSLAAGARKDYPRAIWMLELALKKAPTEGLFHYQMGRMHWELEDDVAALKELKMASDMNPGLTDAHWVMGQIALQRGDTTEAERLLDKTLDNDSKHLPALMAMASIKSKAKDWPAAESYLSRALRSSPKNAKVRMAMNQVQEKMKADRPQAQTPKSKKVSARKPSGNKKVD